MKFTVSVIRYVEVEAECKDDAVAEAMEIAPHGVSYDVVNIVNDDDWYLFYV